MYKSFAAGSFLMVCGAVAMQSAWAAPAGDPPGHLNRIAVCHYDADTGLFKPLRLKAIAASNHLEKHADQLPGVDPGTGAPVLDEDCMVILPPAVLARAYIDVNRNGAYDSMDDVEVAEWVDTNRDNAPTIGDTVRLGQVPLSMDPCPDGLCEDLASFAVEEVEITNMDYSLLNEWRLPGSAIVPIEGPVCGHTWRFTWLDTKGAPEGLPERELFELGAFPNGNVSLTDSHDATRPTEIYIVDPETDVIPGGPCEYQQKKLDVEVPFRADIVTTEPGDKYFLNVELLYTP